MTSPQTPKEKPEPHYALRGLSQASSQLTIIADLTISPSTYPLAHSALAALTSFLYLKPGALLLPRRLWPCSSCRCLLGSHPLLGSLFKYYLLSEIYPGKLLKMSSFPL